MFLKISNFFRPLLRRFHYRSRPNPFAIFQEKINKSNNVSNNKIDKTIILAPFRVSGSSNIFEGLIGYYFRLKGYRVKAVICDQGVTFCDNLSKNDSFKNLRCSLCLAEQASFCKTFGFESLSIKDQLSTSEIKNIDDIIENRTFENSNDFVFEGIDLKDDIYSGTLRYTLKSQIITKEDKEILKKAARTSFIVSKSITRILKNETNVLKLILSHGIYCTWGSILTSCNKVGLKTIVWGRGYLGQGNLLFGHNRSIHSESIYEDNTIWQNEKLSYDQEKAVVDYVQQKIVGNSSLDHVNYYSNLNTIDFDVVEFKNKIKQYDKVFGMFTNIPWDGQVFNVTKGFPSTMEYISHTINWFIKNPNCLLVIRAHPAEKSRSTAKGTETFAEILNSIYEVLPKNVIFLEPENPISSYDLSKLIDAAILYGSSLSLEFAILGIPIIQTGRYNVNGKEIVFEAEDKNQFWNFLDQAKSGNLIITPKMKEDILKYAYHWYYRRHIVDTSLNLSSLSFQGYNFNSIKEFQEDKMLTFVFESIINDTVIVNK
jgi:hypothetical protein